MIDNKSRYQTQLFFTKFYPSRGDYCACGCGNKIVKPKKKWFSRDCQYKAILDFYIIKGDVKIIRQELYKRDGGICRLCGLVCDYWEADHIIPVSYGGGGCGLSNFQTLCVECHKEKTYKVSHHKHISVQAAFTRSSLSL